MPCCTRCREECRVLVTAAKICLNCVQYLSECGATWASGDATYLEAITQWIQENADRFEHLQPAQ